MWCEYRITGAVFLLFGCVLFTAGEEVVRLQELEGNTVLLHTGLTGIQSNVIILWFYSPDSARITIVESREEINSKYPSDRFRDRLQLDRGSGSLTIRNINREDSGLYTLQIITGTPSFRSFRVKVYAPVSKPVIRNESGTRCFPECSVENGEDVSLSWYEDEERISSISASDSSDSSLYLPLNRTFPNNHTYTCVSSNPVINKTTKLNITQLCCLNTDPLCSKPPGRNLYAFLIPVGVFLAALLLSVIVYAVRKNKRNQTVSEDKDMCYAEVKTAPKKPKEFQNSKQEDNGEPVVYASVRN